MLRTGVILVVFCAVVVVYCAPETQMCSGFCMQPQECPVKAEPGLCLNNGDICCHGVSLLETRCKKRGGDCVDSCPEKIRDPMATDCPKNNYCCIYVN